MSCSLQALKQQHESELSSLESELREKHRQQLDELKADHLDQLQSARSQLSISQTLERDYNKLIEETEALKQEIEDYKRQLEALEANRDSLIAHATGQSIHDSLSQHYCVYVLLVIMQNSGTKFSKFLLSTSSLVCSMRLCKCL